MFLMTNLLHNQGVCDGHDGTAEDGVANGRKHTGHPRRPQHVGGERESPEQESSRHQYSTEHQSLMHNEVIVGTTHTHR